MKHVGQCVQCLKYFLANQLFFPLHICLTSTAWRASQPLFQAGVRWPVFDQTEKILLGVVFWLWYIMAVASLLRGTNDCEKNRARSRHLNFDFMHVSTLLHCFHPLICIARPAPVKSGLPGHGWMWKPNDSIGFRLLWVVMSRLIFDAWTVCWILDFSVNVKHAKCLLGCDPPLKRNVQKPSDTNKGKGHALTVIHTKLVEPCPLELEQDNSKSACPECEWQVTWTQLFFRIKQRSPVSLHPFLTDLSEPQD